MSEFGQGIGDDETVVPFSVSVLNLLQEISDKLDRPMISVVNNGTSSAVNPDPVIVDPNFEMLASVSFEVASMLDKVLDNPDLNTFDKARALREISSKIRKRGENFKKQADEIKAKLEREK